MVRVAKNKIIFVVPNKRCLWYKMGKIILQIINKWPYGYEGDYTVKELIAMAEKAGLINIRSEKLLCFPPPEIGFLMLYPPHFFYQLCYYLRG